MSQPAPIASVDVSTAAQRLSGSSDPAPLLIDVRERDEFMALRIEGAVLMPLSSFADTFERLPRDRPLLMLCAAGKRSLAATDHLSRQGFADVTNVTGGITAWRAAGLPVRDDAVRPGEGDLPDEGEQPGEGGPPAR
ncbi:MAG: rhodanese-like domain-containing protein [Chloroflexota bacterium]|nr:rhodanese-like domain-containing protein [Chloroflexota bacterium]